MAWMVYVLVSASGGSTYVGISTDPERRLSQQQLVRERRREAEADRLRLH